jgi:hypothetical protein
MAKKKNANSDHFVAVVGIDFESLKPAARVEPGEQIPDQVSAGEIKDLLEMGLIKPEAKRK